MHIVKKNTDHQFTIKFRKKDIAAKVFHVERYNTLVDTTARTIRIYGQYLKLRKSKEWRHFTDGILPHDARVICDKIGRWYLCQPYDCEVAMAKPQDIHSTVGIDPGVRDFVTYYSPEIVGAIGRGSNLHLEKARCKLNKMQSKHDRCKNKRRRRSLKCQMLREMEHMKNQRNDMHLKACVRF